MEEMQREQKRDQRRVCVGFIVAAIGIFCIVIAVILLLSKSPHKEKNVTTEARKYPKMLVENYTSAMSLILLRLQEISGNALRAD